jgi:hypothetical protein
LLLSTKVSELVLDKFWTSFSENASRWAATMHDGNIRSVFEEIDALLALHGVGVCFDVTIDDSSICCLIFSPEGDESAALLIDNLVASAQPCDGWRILGRRPQKELSDAAAIVSTLYMLDPTQMRFRLVRGRNIRCVEMIVPQSADLTPAEAQGMINTFLWHAIGEDFVMKHAIRGQVRFADDEASPSLSAAEIVKLVRAE